MASMRPSIQLKRLLLAFLVTFLVADTCPHPHLRAGLIATTLHQLKTPPLVQP